LSAPVNGEVSTNEFPSGKPESTAFTVAITTPLRLMFVDRISFKDNGVTPSARTFGVVHVRVTFINFSLKLISMEEISNTTACAAWV